jgi:hypothetical protein
MNGTAQLAFVIRPIRHPAANPTQGRRYLDISNIVPLNGIDTLRPLFITLIVIV